MTKQDVNLKAFVRKNYAWLMQTRDAGTLTMRGLSRRVMEAYGVSVEPRVLSVVMSQVKNEKSASENTAENDTVVAMRVDNKPPADQALVSTPIANEVDSNGDYKSVCVNLKQFYHIDPARLAEQVLAHLKSLPNEQFVQFVNYKIKPVLKRSTGIIDLNDIK